MVGEKCYNRVTDGFIENAQKHLKEMDNYKELSDYEKLLKVHRYICNHASYDYKELNRMKNLDDIDNFDLADAHDAIGFIRDGKIVCGGYAVIIGIRESFCHNRHRHQFCYGKNSGNSHDSLSCCLFMTFITPIYYNECHCVATRHHHGQKITHFLLGHKRKQHQLRRRPQQCKCVRTAQKSQLRKAADGIGGDHGHRQRNGEKPPNTLFFPAHPVNVQVQPQQQKELIDARFPENAEISVPVAVILKERVLQ